MNLYQVEITTEIDTECILINANDEDEAISIAQYMLENGEIDFAIGHEIINITAFLGTQRQGAQEQLLPHTGGGGQRGEAQRQPLAALGGSVPRHRQDALEALGTHHRLDVP